MVSPTGCGRMRATLLLMQVRILPRVLLLNVKAAGVYLSAVSDPSRSVHDYRSTRKFPRFPTGSLPARRLVTACGCFVVSCDEQNSDTVICGTAPNSACAQIQRDESARKRSLKSGRCWRATRSVRTPACGKIRYYSPMP